MIECELEWNGYFEQILKAEDFFQLPRGMDCGALPREGELVECNGVKGRVVRSKHMILMKHRQELGSYMYFSYAHVLIGKP